MTDTIKYNFGAIDATAADIQTTSARLGGRLDELRNRLQPMVATWEGESADAYQVAQAKWDRAAADLKQILDAIARTVSQGNERMSTINRQAANSWG